MAVSSGASLANVLRPARQLPPHAAALPHLYRRGVKVRSTRSVAVSGRWHGPLLSRGIITHPALHAR